MPGKLNGTIAATTPSGWRIMCSSMPAAISSQLVPCIIIGIAHAVSTFSTARRISALLSASVLPHSSVMESASSSRCCSSSVFSLNSGWMRSTTGVRRHSKNARCATSTAAFTSAAGESGTSASTLADAGLITFSASLRARRAPRAIDEILQPLHPNPSSGKP